LAQIDRSAGSLVCVAEEPTSWRWVVEGRFPMTPRQGPRVIVIGEHVGESPRSGEPVLVHDPDRVVSPTVDCLMRFERRQGNDVSGYSWALTLRDVAVEDVAIGSIVTRALR
jgi:hypothetical protein